MSPCVLSIVDGFLTETQSLLAPIDEVAVSSKLRLNASAPCTLLATQDRLAATRFLMTLPIDEARGLSLLIPQHQCKETFVD